MAARALVTPATRIEMTIAEPAPGWALSPVMAEPMATKMPAPMMAPTPRAVSWTEPRERLRPPPEAPSAMHWSTVFRAKSDMRLQGGLPREFQRVHACDGDAVERFGRIELIRPE